MRETPFGEGMAESDSKIQSAEALCKSAIDAGGALLLVPGLLASLSTAAGDTHRLCQLLGLAEIIRCDAGEYGLEDLAMAGMRPSQRRSCAALLTHQVDFPHEPSANVLRSDPVYQQIDMNNATLSDPALLCLDNEEATALLRTLNEHFAEDGMRFEHKAPHRWYCHFNVLPDIETMTLSAAIGHDVADCRPEGHDARMWRSKLAEIEMLLFEHPVNLAREARSELPVNSLWLWGEGQCDEKASVASVEVAADDFYTNSLASYCKIPIHSLQSLEKASTQNKAMILAVNELAVSAARSDEQAFEKNLQWVERHVAAVLWKNLKRDHWPVIVIWCGDDRFFKVESSVKNKIWRKAWRKPLPLSSFIPVNEHAAAFNEA